MPTTSTYLLSARLPVERLDADPTRFNIWGSGRIDNTRRIDPTKKTYVITHGLLNTGGNPGNNFTPNSWISEMADSIRAKDPTANIVITEWDSRSVVGYAWSPISVQGVASQLADFLSGNNVNPANTTLIGHSLGSHISGLASERLGGNINTVIALDPAGPIYEILPVGLRLSPSSANRVVAIHTSKLFGYDFPIGHQDIYVNPTALFHPGANNAIDNHGYATTLFNELLQGKNINGLTLDFLLRRDGVFVADTIGNNRIAAWPKPLPFIASDYFWDLLRRQYITPKNKPVAPVVVDQIRERRIEQVKTDLDTIGQLLVDGKISLDTWQDETARALRKLHIEQAILARGGSDRMTKADYLAVGRNLKEEYKYLRNFAQELADGKITEAEFKARLKLYAGRSRRSYAVMERQNYKDDGYVYMQRFLDRIAVHCQECVRYAAEGVQPIGKLPLPTEQCRCGGNCKCTVRYYRNLGEAG